MRSRSNYDRINVDVVWRGDLQKPPGLYKGGHLVIRDYLLKVTYKINVISLF